MITEFTLKQDLQTLFNLRGRGAPADAAASLPANLAPPANSNVPKILSWDEVINMSPNLIFSNTSEYRVRTVDFGNGYRQQVSEGNNNVRQSFTLEFGNRHLWQINLSKFFLDLHAGIHPFYWTEPGTRADLDSKILGVATNVSADKNGVGVGTLRFTFEQRFETEIPQ